MEISDEQWEEARRLFAESLPESAGMPVEKRDDILRLLDTWDDLSPSERREQSKGNHMYWDGKYMVVGDSATEPAVLCYKETGVTDITQVKQVAAREELFDCILKVHTSSAPAACLCHSPSPGCCRTLPCAVFPCLLLEPPSTHPPLFLVLLRKPLQGLRPVQGVPAGVRQLHSSIGDESLREALPHLHQAGEGGEEEGGWISAHHHQGLCKERSGECPPQPCPLPPHT
jgi:hypothetical protein